ncbi:MAG: PIN domain-containing protein [Pyrinomonadaceae bacterium]
MFVDTSGFYCFFDRKDFCHDDAKTFINSAESCLTQSYVLAEFIPLCQSRGLNRAKILEFAATLFDNRLIEVVWVDERLHRAAFEFLQQRKDKHLFALRCRQFYNYARAQPRRSLDDRQTFQAGKFRSPAQTVPITFPRR